jgi:hypothetical protein
MKRNLLLAIILVAVSAQLSFAQEEIKEEELIGFACFYEGEPSEKVKEVAGLLHKKNYKGISKLLASSNNAERYLAVVSLERLNQYQQYSFTDEEKKRIAEIKSSESEVTVCSGCLMLEKIAMKHLFSEMWQNFATSWLDKNIKR